MIEILPEALLFSFIAFVMALGYKRLRLFDLTAGFWVVIFPHAFLKFQGGEVKEFVISLSILLTIALFQILIVGKYLSRISKQRELYTILSFFASLVLSAAAALYILPVFNALLPEINPFNLNFWGPAFIISLGILLYLVSLNKSAAKILFANNFDRREISQELALPASLIVSLQIILYCIIGVLFSQTHIGLLPKAPELSIIPIAMVALTRPSSIKSVIIAGAGAFCAIYTIDFIQPKLSRLLTAAEIDFTIQMRPMALLIFISILFLFQKWKGFSVPVKTDEMPVFNHKEMLMSAMAAFCLVLIVSTNLVFNYLSPPEIKYALLLIIFGLITAYIYFCYSVYTIAIPSIGFVALTGLFHLLSLPFSSLVVNWLLVTFCFILLTTLFAGYLWILRRQDRAYGILIDLIVVFAFSSFAFSLKSFSGSSGSIDLSTNQFFMIGESVKYGGLSLIAVGSVGFPAWLGLFEKRQHGKVLRGDITANIVALSFPRASSLHGYRSFYLLTIFSSFVLFISIATAYLYLGRDLSIDHVDYGLTPGLIVLAIGFSVVVIRNVWIALFVTGLLILPRMLDMFDSSGTVVEMLFGVIGMLTIYGVAMKNDKFDLGLKR